MTTRPFRSAAIALIAFNLVGTVVTWTAQLHKPGTGAAHAVLQGTEFTGPLVFIAAWVACAIALWRPGRAGTVATWLMTLFALAYSVGEVSELTKHNIGVSSAKWDTIIAFDLAGLALGLTVTAFGVASIARTRRLSPAARA